MIFNTHYPYIGGGGGGGVPQYEYTGQSTFIDDGSGNWRLKFLTSGTLTLKNKITVDVFLVGGGGAGGYGAFDFGNPPGGGGGGASLTDDDILECLIGTDMLSAVKDVDGAILTDENSKILLM